MNTFPKRDLPDYLLRTSPGRSTPCPCHQMHSLIHFALQKQSPNFFARPLPITTLYCAKPPPSPKFYPTWRLTRCSPDVTDLHLTSDFCLFYLFVLNMLSIEVFFLSLVFLLLSFWFPLTSFCFKLSQFLFEFNLFPLFLLSMVFLWHFNCFCVIFNSINVLLFQSFSFAFQSISLTAMCVFFFFLSFLLSSLNTLLALSVCLRGRGVCSLQIRIRLY